MQRKENYEVVSAGIDVMTLRGGQLHLAGFANKRASSVEKKLCAYDVTYMHHTEEEKTLKRAIVKVVKAVYHGIS